MPIDGDGTSRREARDIPYEVHVADVVLTEDSFHTSHDPIYLVIIKLHTFLLSAVATK